MKKWIILLLVLLSVCLLYEWYTINQPQQAVQTSGSQPHQIPVPTRTGGMETNSLPSESGKNTSKGIPDYVLKTWDYVQTHHEAPRGYVGGRIFQDREDNLPDRDENNRRITYQEWDVHPRRPGRNRGTERLVTGSDGSAWFSKDHYRSFVRVQ